MKKITLLLSFILFCLVLFYACKRENPASFQSSQNGSGKEMVTKINAWLERQKSATLKNKNSNIDLLKENLDFENSKVEQLNQDERFLIIPVKEELKTKKNLAKNTIINLILILDKTNNIKRGEISLFSPSEGKTIDKLPENTFYKVFTYKMLNLDGQFKFLSVSGRWNYQLEYKGGKLNSYGKVTQKDDKSGKLNANCNAWYLHTIYYVDGVIVYETWEFLGVTCESDGCDSPNYMSLCANDGGGGEDDCCISDPNFQWIAQSVSIPDIEQCGTSYKDPNTGLITKSCVHKWKYFRNSILWWNWYNVSKESYITQNEGGFGGLKIYNQ